MKTLKEIAFTLVLGASLGALLVHSLDAELECREQSMGIRHVAH